MKKEIKIVVIGGGAAGFFGAIAAAQANPQAQVILLEKNRQLLSKVRVSGGGRCNVTHACFDPNQLIKNYPRGNKALLGPFTRFQPRDTMAWFNARGVNLKTESDYRVFPSSDSSETIINCLLSQAKAAGVHIRTECNVLAIKNTALDDANHSSSSFSIQISHHSAEVEILQCDRLLIATGGTAKAYEWIKALGHSIQPPVPSLFTFNVPTSPLSDLSGISLAKVHLSLKESALEQSGPLLITHWGFSGPAVLKLSAWGARFLHDLDYQATLSINWLPDLKPDSLRKALLNAKKESGARLISGEYPVDLPRNLWRKLLEGAAIAMDLRWAMLSKSQLENLLKGLQASTYEINGKTTFKEEFVTCGGVTLKEVDFKTMQSRFCPGLYFAGEVLDIDGVTGGFNFQNAWTTGWLAGQAMAIGCAHSAI